MSIRLRFLSRVLLLAALAGLVFDAVHSPSGSTTLAVTSLGDLWAAIHPGSLDWVREAVETHLPLSWNITIFPLLRLPVWLFLGASGLGFNLLYRHRQRPSSAQSNLRIAVPMTTLHLMGILVLGAGFGALLLDVIPELSTSRDLSITTIGNVWLRQPPAGFEFAETPFPGSLPPSLWDPVILVLLRTPAWLLVALFGVGLYSLGSWRDRAALNAQPTVDLVMPAASTGPATPQASPRSELAAALSASRTAFLGIGLFSGMSNLLMLTGAFFMLEVYDRVLPSRSVPTLVALAVLVAGLFTAQGILDMIRGRILSRIAASLDEALSERVYGAIVRLPLKSASRGDGLQPLRDLDAIRAFLSGQGPTALFDLPWMPVYLAIIFSFHTMLGVTALIGAIILVVMTLLTEALTRRPMMVATGFAMSRNGLAEASRRNAEVLTAMGMAGRMGARWSEANQSYMASNQQVSDVAGGFGSISRSFRMMLQSAVLGVGAYFVINGEATAGIIIAGAILVSRALAPVDLAIANWKVFVAARQSWQRLNKLLALLPAQVPLMLLPDPTMTLSVENASGVPPGERKMVVQDASFRLEGGQGLGIIGPSGSGKSSLVRLLVGAWQPARGQIRLDGAALSQWTPEVLGRHIGYLPQDVELFAGTVAQNIGRFELDATSETIIAAAQAAGVHDLIVKLPDGYETELGDEGKALSAGQRQRVALARALYRDPFLVVLDEPNSNLDAEGEAALTQAILGVRARGGIVIVVAHRRTALAGVDLLLVMGQGRAMAFGPKDEVLAKAVRPAPAKQSPLTIVPGSGAKTP